MFKVVLVLCVASFQPISVDLELQKDIVENLYALGLICEPAGDPIEWTSPCAKDEVVCNLPDLTQDGDVGIDDFLYLIGHWGEEDCLDRWRSDINKDRIIGIEDLLILLAAWGEGYESCCWDRCDC